MTNTKIKMGSVFIATAPCPYCQREVYLDEINSDPLEPISYADPTSTGPLRKAVLMHYASNWPYAGWTRHEWDLTHTEGAHAVLRPRTAILLEPR